MAAHRVRSVVIPAVEEIAEVIRGCGDSLGHLAEKTFGSTGVRTGWRPADRQRHTFSQIAENDRRDRVAQNGKDLLLRGDVLRQYGSYLCLRLRECIVGYWILAGHQVVEIGETVLQPIVEGKQGVDDLVAVVRVITNRRVQELSFHPKVLEDRLDKSSPLYGLEILVVGRKQV